MPELAETKTEAAPVAAADPVARIEDDDDDESDDTIPDLEDAGKLIFAERVLFLRFKSE